LAELEAHADLEHQQDKPDLRQDDDGGRRLESENGSGNTGAEMPKQGWAKQQAGDNFANDPWLAEAAEYQVHQACSAYHDNQLDKNGEQQRLGLLLGRNACGHYASLLGFSPV
jgi:hypothetical protein